MKWQDFGLWAILIWAHARPLTRSLRGLDGNARWNARCARASTGRCRRCQVLHRDMELKVPTKPERRGMALHNPVKPEKKPLAADGKKQRRLALRGNRPRASGCSGQSTPLQPEIQSDGVMIGQRRSPVVDLRDHARRELTNRTDPAAGEPVKFHRALATGPLECPIDEPEAPPRHPVSHVGIDGHIIDVVVKRTATGLVE